MGDTAGPIYAFLDSQNLNLGVRNDIYNKHTGKLVYRGWQLDFIRFFIYLRDKYKVDKAYLFIGRVPQNESLYSSLENAGYTVIYKPTLQRWHGNEKETKGNVDAELILHTMIQLPNYGKAIIVAGDGDYHCLIEYLESLGKLNRVLIPNRYSYSSLLSRFRDYFDYVSDLRGKLEYHKQATKKRE
jgi:uncharacterized LabA/DUF88 family protein